MAVLNGHVTISGIGVYWQLTDARNPDVLTIRVGGHTPRTFKEVLKEGMVPGIWAPVDEYGAWTFDLDAIKEHADPLTSSRFPSWVGGRVRAQPSARGGAQFDITPDMLG